MKAFFVCSFGTGRNNKRLEEAVKRILPMEKEAIIVAQWEVARELEKDGIKPTHVIEPLPNNSYLSTRLVWEEARAYLELYDVTEVIIIANPFIHAYYIEKMVRKDGFRVDGSHSPEVGHIGFDPKSLQWWTRGPVLFAIYAIISAVGLSKFVHHK